jgi:hypothetical protein
LVTGLSPWLLSVSAVLQSSSEDIGGLFHAALSKGLECGFHVFPLTNEVGVHLPSVLDHSVDLVGQLPDLISKVLFPWCSFGHGGSCLSFR